MNTESTKQKKLGRPVFNVNWPEGSFSAKDVYKALEGKLSHVSVKLKINKAVSEGSLRKVEVVKQATGRPVSIYQKTA